MTQSPIRPLSGAHHEEGVEELRERVLVLVQLVRQLLQPAVDERLEADDGRLEEHHAAAADRGRGGDRQVLHLKHHRHLLRAEGREVNTVSSSSPEGQWGERSTQCHRHLLRDRGERDRHSVIVIS